MNCDSSFHTEEEMLASQLQSVRDEAYRSVLGDGMNRAERRTAKGRMLEAQAEAAMLRAEVEFLRGELKALGRLA